MSDSNKTVNDLLSEARVSNVASKETVNVSELKDFPRTYDCRGDDDATSVRVEAKALGSDKLTDMFRRQEEFMQMLKDADKLPEWPIDITSKYGQRQLKEINGELVGELYEAMYILKNRSHRFTDHTDVDFEHFKEELGDALAYFMELCLMSGIGPDELYAEYCRKNAMVKKRAKDGY